MKLNVTIVDYGVGNIYSIANSLRALQYNVRVSSKCEELEKADALILPGVGAFNAAMDSLRSSRLVEPLTALVKEHRKPILGICLGMQLMAHSSTENGYHKGLAWIEGEVVKLQLPESFRVPHVGWNTVTVNKSADIFARIPLNTDFYFDHSYHFVCKSEYKIATCSYGRELAAAVNFDNIYGVQFHPEKSQKSGLKLFRGFLQTIQDKLEMLNA